MSKQNKTKQNKTKQNKTKQNKNDLTRFQKYKNYKKIQNTKYKIQITNSKY